MNKAQFEYDNTIQFINRTEEIKKLEQKILRLQQVSDDIRRLQKIKNTDLHIRELHRKNKDIRQFTERTELQSIDELELPDITLQNTKKIQRTRFRSRSAGLCKARRNTPKYPTDAESMKRVASVLIDQGILSEVRSDIRDWILQFYQSEGIMKKDNILPDDLLPEINNEIQASRVKLQANKVQLHARRCC